MNIKRLLLVVGCTIFTAPCLVAMEGQRGEWLSEEEYAALMLATTLSLQEQGVHQQPAPRHRNNYDDRELEKAMEISKHEAEVRQAIEASQHDEQQRSNHQKVMQDLISVAASKGDFNQVAYLRSIGCGEPDYNQALRLALYHGNFVALRMLIPHANHAAGILEYGLIAAIEQKSPKAAELIKIVQDLPFISEQTYSQALAKACELSNQVLVDMLLERTTTFDKEQEIAQTKKAPVKSKSETANGEKEETKPQHECSICLDNSDTIDAKTKCGHYFHQACLNKWLGKENTCPECRSEKVAVQLIKHN